MCWITWPRNSLSSSTEDSEHQVLFKKHMCTQTGSSRTVCERAQGQQHSSALDQIYLQSKEIQIPVHPFLKAYYIKVEGAGTLLFTLLTEPGGLCNQEC